MRNWLLATSVISGATMLVTAGAYAADADSGVMATVTGSQPAGAATTPIRTVTAATDTTASNASTVQELVVTGSRIPQPNLTSVAPIASVSNTELQVEGKPRIEDLVNNLPQVAASFGGNESNGSTGTSTVDLRNLGPNRTLVLIDGRRMGMGDPSGAAAVAPDLDMIPAALIDHIEVDTASASTIYGSDAVAGVVNFIMRKNFEGVEVDANYSFYQHDQQNPGNVQQAVAARNFQEAPSSIVDGRGVNVTGIIGVNAPDDKGNITAYLGYRQIDPVVQSHRDFSACALADSKTGFSCSGSSTNPNGRFIFFGAPTGMGAPSTTLDEAVTGTGASSAFTPFGSKFLYNYGPLNYFQTKDTTITAGLFGHYDFNRHVSAYTEFMFMDDDLFAQIAPSGAFGETFNVNCNNPLLTSQEVGQLCGNLPATSVVPVTILRRDVEGGPRIDDRKHTDYRMVAGLRGDIDEDGVWKYDVYGLYATTIFQDTYLNDVSLQRAQFALNDCIGAPSSGIGSGCVPWNIWQGGGVTPEAIAYISSPGFQNATLTDEVLEGSITGDLGKLGIQSPWASHPVALAVGADWRRESMDFKTDAEFTSGDLTGQGGPRVGTQGSFHVGEFYFEVRAPLIEDAPFAKSLTFHGSYRYSNFSSSGGVSSYALGPTWRINDDIMLRAGYNRAVRAPNIVELYSPQSVALDFTNDPCAGPAVGGLVQGHTAAQCALTGVSAAQFGKIVTNPASQYYGVTGGNPALQPEIADTWSGGIVLTPHFLPSFSLSIDYWNIAITGGIAGIGAQTTINNCVAGSNTGFFCPLIHRQPGSGSLWLGTGTNDFVTDTNQNVASYQTSGIDFDGNYRLDFQDMNWGNYGSLVFNFEGTYTIDYYIQSLSTLPKFNCVDSYGQVCQGTGSPMFGPSPTWRHSFRVTWNTPWDGIATSLQWRYFSSVKADSCSSDPQLSNPSACFPGVDATLPAVNYLDLEASWKIKTGLTARFGVNNVLDQDPPLIGTNNLAAPPVGNGNTYPQTYDAMGRFFFFNVTAAF